MTRLPGLHLSVGVSGIGPSFKFSNDGSLGAPGTVGDGGNAGSWAAVPNAHFTWQLAPDWFIGLGISSPFGLKTEYDDNWLGSYQALKSEVTTINYNPSLAWKLSDRISLGLGVNYQTIDAEITNMTPLGRYQLKGDDAAWGWNAGVLFTLSPAMRVGASYRSAVNYTLEGDRTLGNSSTAATAGLKLPDVLILSVWQQVSERWEAMGDLSWTRWKTVDTLTVNYVTPAGLRTESENFDYDSSWRFAWGAAYKANEAWKIKFGISYDRTPTTDETRSARVPDNDRLGFSFGGQWNGGVYGVIDAGYAYLYLKDPKINQASPFGTSLRGSYNDSAHILGAQYSKGF